MFARSKGGRQREELEDGFPMENKTLPRDCFLSHKPFIERSLHAVLIISVSCSWICNVWPPSVSTWARHAACKYQAQPHLKTHARLMSSFEQPALHFRSQQSHVLSRISSSFMKSWRCTIVFTTARPPLDISPSQINPVHLTFLTFILILSSHLRSRPACVLFKANECVQWTNSMKLYFIPGRQQARTYGLKIFPTSPSMLVKHNHRHDMFLNQLHGFRFWKRTVIREATYLCTKFHLNRRPSWKFRYET
jgi:hypothetical protein